MKKQKPKIIDMQQAQREITEKYAIQFEKERQDSLKQFIARKNGFGCA